MIKGKRFLQVLLCQRKQRYYIYNYFGLLWCIGTASLASFTVHWREVRRKTYNIYKNNMIMIYIH